MVGFGTLNWIYIDLPFSFCSSTTKQSSFFGSILFKSFSISSFLNHVSCDSLHISCDLYIFGFVFVNDQSHDDDDDDNKITKNKT